MSLPAGEMIHYDGDDVIEDSSVFVLNSQNTYDTYDEGVVHMGTTFATDSFDELEASWEPPSGDLSRQPGG